MTTVAEPPASEDVEVEIFADPVLQHEIEQFLYLEVELLDERRYRQWFNLLADDIIYFMPVRANRTMREMEFENSAPGGVANFDDNKRTMAWRVNQLESGLHWSEDPPSRTRHLVNNVRVRPGENQDEFKVRSNFLCYSNRLDVETDIWAGERQDVIRRVGLRRWKIAKRYILLDQNVVLSKNLSVFF